MLKIRHAYLLAIFCLGAIFSSVAQDTLSIQFLDSILFTQTKRAINIGEFKLTQKEPAEQIFELKTRLGIAYDVVGEFNSSAEYLFEALEIGEEIKASDEKMAYVYYNLGITQYHLWDYEKASKTYQKAIEIYKKINDTESVAKLLTNLGICYTYMGKQDEALENYYEAIALYRKLNQPQMLPTVYANIVKIYSNKKDFKKAQLYLDSVDVNYLTDYNLVTNHISKATVYFHLKQLGKASEFAKKAVQLAKDRDYNERLIYAYEIQSLIEIALGNIENGSKIHSLYLDMIEKSYQNETSESVAKAEALYEVEKNKRLFAEEQLQKNEAIKFKDKMVEETERLEYQIIWIVVIACLSLLSLFLVVLGFIRTKKSREVLREKNLIIEKSLEEKEVLMAEIHHRVKNNLQLVKSILDLQSRSIDNPKAKDALLASLNRINAISLVHHKLYTTDSVSEINTDSYIKELVNAVSGIYRKEQKQIEIQTQVADFLLPLDKAIPLGLIITELITNSYKYAFLDRDSGMISVQLEKKDEIVLTISDNGSGIDENQEKRGDSFGMLMIKSMVKQISGTLISENSDGLKTTIKFKIND